LKSLRSRRRNPSRGFEGSRRSARRAGAEKTYPQLCAAGLRVGLTGTNSSINIRVDDLLRAAWRKAVGKGAMSELRNEIVGKVALVTGASSGLGAHFARVLAEAGAMVVPTARRVDRLEALATAIRDAGGRAHPLALDVTSVAAIRDVVGRIGEQVGAVDILVNNAGMSHEGRLEDVEEEDFDIQIGTNLKGAFFVAQAVARQMIAAKRRGRIVNIGSVVAARPTARVGIYGMTKAAIVHMTRQMARDWGRHGINTNAISPGYITTEINDEFLATEQGRNFVSTLPRRRVGDPSDLTALLLLLCSGQSSRFINGAIIAADDGFAAS